ncbi:MAG TPA: M23 family metallopeptidase [Candidatus Paceibacterota bacterium]|nr:M23 family metallopeptidase [Candidatus Paceibacterota bacterium]
MLRPNPIFTDLKKLLRRLHITGSAGYARLKKTSSHKGVQLFTTVSLALILIVLKSHTGDESGFFNSVVHHYIEETSAAINASGPDDQLADISGLAVQQDTSGRGSDINLLSSSIQENSIVASDPSSTDYLTSFLPNKVIEYTVQPGDAISFIASDFGVSVNSIIWANNLKSADAISPGQVLKIPPISGVIHTVAKGDTVSSIAKKYNADADKIIAFNDITDNQLTVGNDIVVPNGTVPGSNRVSSTSVVVSTAQNFSHLPDLGDYFLIPTTGYDWGIIHDRNGVDIANSCGTPIHAAADGSVAIALSSGWNGGFGEYIKVIHGNGTETLYAHLSKLFVNAGETVTKGETIALMGTTGHSTGCHLHFEVHGAKNPLAK